LVLVVNIQSPILLALDTIRQINIYTHYMAGDRKLVGRLDQLSIRPPTPPLTTSPDSPTPSAKPLFHETLPSSSIDIILAELRNRRRGRPQQESEWWCIKLGLDEFDSFEARIQTDEDLDGFVADKVKYVCL
jgi:hypothetical protein